MLKERIRNMLIRNQLKISNSYHRVEDNRLNWIPHVEGMEISSDMLLIM
jgi:hypothetical protein